MTPTLEKKIAWSKRFIERIAENRDRLQIANSGGKDSLVIYTLCKEVLGKDLPPIVYANTTIDPTGTKKYIMDYMPETQIITPSQSFIRLVEKKGLPTRLNRYCCEMLKEHHSIGKRSIEGVRAAESTNRQGREPEQCDTRKKQKGAVHIYPIYYWTDDEVWSFIKEKGLEVAPCYHKGMCRLGCVGCPQAKPSVRRMEFDLYPRHFQAIKKAIGRGMANNPQWKLTQLCDGNEDVAMEWWLTRDTMAEFFEKRKRTLYLF